ncbi:sodium channel protein Nach-like [Bombus impatiens]|uniref:Sodium channel protein Nach-like n=1 Tax=Bombus impatiens TaxID=132113 RepID=A0A6P8LYH3_BOMIM|nr:sodium channel protein Nach-like [Bombus impatiens]
MKVWYEGKPKYKKEFEVPLDWLLETRTTRSRSRFTRTLMKYSKLYCKYTKLAGFRYFVDSEATWFDSFAANISDLPVDEILNMISQLGDLYDSEFKPQNRLYRIDQLLTVFYNGYYSITDIMKRLTPQCSSMLSKCRFHDEERNYSELFAFRKTQDGFCCTFNYATKGDDTHLNREVSHRVESMKVQNLTENGGLSVLLEPFLDDYFYPIFPSAGWKVTIFNPYDYPDMTSGGVIDFLVSPRVHRSVELEAIMFYSIRSIMSYALEKRDCVFEDEMTSLRMFYTYSDCIVDCKTQDMWKICKCIPFFLPNRESRRVCNLEDVPCLSQHKCKHRRNSRDVNHVTALNCPAELSLCHGLYTKLIN